jgi:hypothetical protein
MRRRSSRSLSPVRREEKGKQRQIRSLSSVHDTKSVEEEAWFQEEFQSAAEGNGSDTSDADDQRGPGSFAARLDDTPFDDPIDAMNTWSPKYRSSKEALDELAAWAPSVMEYNPKKPVYDPLSWNTDWLDKVYLVIEDPWTLARLKTLCALFPSELDNIQVVLEYAMRLACPSSFVLRCRTLELSVIISFLLSL